VIHLETAKYRDSSSFSQGLDPSREISKKVLTATLVKRAAKCLIRIFTYILLRCHKLLAVLHLRSFNVGAFWFEGVLCWGRLEPNSGGVEGAARRGCSGTLRPLWRDACPSAIVSRGE